MGHRAEPLIYERLWGCRSELEEGQRDVIGWLHQAGLDAQGRVICVRHLPPTDDPNGATGWTETIAYEPRRTEVDVGGGRVVTTFDDESRPLRSVYVGMPGSPNEETYIYDDEGLLVEIEEAPALGMTIEAGRGSGWSTGGSLAVRHDGAGVSQVVHTSSGIEVWKRCDEDWSDVLDRGVQRLYEDAVRIVSTHCEQMAIPVDSDVSSLVLDYTGDGGLAFFVHLRLRPSRDVSVRDQDPHLDRTYELTDHDEPDVVIEDMVELSFESEMKLTREAAFHQPENPLWYLLTKVAARLARHDWGSDFRITEDFVAYIDQHDVGLEWKRASLRAANPPERVALWDARSPRAKGI
jgi:hypothetical protein